MENIEVGEYARTKTGKILKVDIIEKCKICPQNEYINIEVINDILFKNIYHQDDIVNHSKNIKDLIQAGDVVKYKFNNLAHTDLGEVKNYIDARSRKEFLGIKGFKLEDVDILEILTKENFENNSYKVVE